MAFHCTVVTPEQQVLDADVSQAILPAHDGLMGLLTDRSPLLVKLGVGPLRLDLPNNEKAYYLLDGGVAQMLGNKLTIVTERAFASNEIDYEAASAEYAAARAKVPQSPADKAKIEHDLAVAQGKQKLAGGPR